MSFSDSDARSTDGESVAGPSRGAPPVYPAFLKLTGRKVLLVGGGPVATGKFPALIAAGADVTIVSPELHPDLVSAAAAAGTTIHRRAFAADDLNGVWYVVAAAPPEINRQVL
ncbi:MAG TPA: NAD(P)-dependent oxidoreductase, partial [Polyangia bacterium]